MTIDKLEVVVFALVFLVPGYILYSTLSVVSIRRNEPAKELLYLRFLSFSALNLLICLRLVVLILDRHWRDAHLWLALLWGLYITFVNPCLLAIFIAWLDKRQAVRALMRMLGFGALHSIPNAWDFKFASLNDKTGGRWVKVTLKDGKCIGGFYGHNSFASTESAERDLYIEATYTISEQEPNSAWQPIELSDGVLISHDVISSITFLFDQSQVTPQSTTRSRFRNLCSDIRSAISRYNTAVPANQLPPTDSNSHTKNLPTSDDVAAMGSQSMPTNEPKSTDKMVRSDQAIKEGHQPQNSIPASQRTPPGSATGTSAPTPPSANNQSSATTSSDKK